jgi:hypothetical protein
MRDFCESNVWHDICEEIDAWIEELRSLLEDPDGPTDPEIIAQTRGSIKACRNFKMCPSVLADNIEDDMLFDKEEKTKKNWR